MGHWRQWNRALPKSLANEVMASRPDSPPPAPCPRSSARKPRSRPFADLQAVIRARKYPAQYWINWFARATPRDLSFDNIERCLQQNPSTEDRIALLELRSRLSQIVAAKPRPKTPTSPETTPSAERFEAFFAHVPRRPYCTERLDDGLRIRALATAKTHKYLQHNPPGQVWSLVIDIDRDVRTLVSGADWGLPGPEPYLAIINPDNGHAHLVYLLAAGVTRTQAARQAPLRYLAAVEQALTRKVGGDPAYSGLITKNPLHESWQTIERNPHRWTLGELAEAAQLKAANDRHSAAVPAEARGMGRNVVLFDKARKWAYGSIAVFWRPGGFENWHQAVLAHLESLNGQFPAPLPFSEIKATAKSIARWTWRTLTPDRHYALVERTHTREIQAARGRRSGAVRRKMCQNIRGLARARAAQGMSYRKIAADLGISLGTVHNYLRQSQTSGECSSNLYQITAGAEAPYSALTAPEPKKSRRGDACGNAGREFSAKACPDAGYSQSFGPVRLKLTGEVLTDVFPRGKPFAGEGFSRPVVAGFSVGAARPEDLNRSSGLSAIPLEIPRRPSSRRSRMSDRAGAGIPPKTNTTSRRLELCAFSDQSNKPANKAAGSDSSPTTTKEKAARSWLDASVERTPPLRRFHGGWRAVTGGPRSVQAFLKLRALAIPQKNRTAGLPPDSGTGGGTAAPQLGAELHKGAIQHEIFSIRKG